MRRVCGVAGLCLALCLASAAAKDERPPLPSSKPKPTSAAAEAKPLDVPKPGLISSFRLDPLRLATTATKTLAVVKPYLKNPLALPAGTKWFLGMAVLSLWFLLQALTAVFSIITKPHAVVMNLCIGTFLFHASLFALRGPPEQMRRLSTQERLPYTMTTLCTMLAAFWAAIENKRWGSWIFGFLHLSAFLLDVFSHVPGGKHMMKFILGAYIRLFRTVFK